MHHRILAGQPLVGPAEALGRENHPMTQAGELGEQLLSTRRKDDIITEGKQVTHAVSQLLSEQDQQVREESPRPHLPVHKQDNHVLVVSVFEKFLLQPADLLTSTNRPSYITSLPLLSQTQCLHQSYYSGLTSATASPLGSNSRGFSSACVCYLHSVVELPGCSHEAVKAIRLFCRCSDDQQVVWTHTCTHTQ